MRDMTFSSYETLLEASLRAGRTIGTVADHLEGKLGEFALILRHDVDRRVEKSLALAKREHRRSIRASYYFRRHGERSPSAAIRRIAGLGHEVGFHYESLSRAKGDRVEALRQFERDLAAMRALAPVRTACMHGAPLSRWNNGDLLRGLDLAAFGLLGDAFLSFEGRPILYLTDTGGRWGVGGGANLRDRIEGSASAGRTPPRRTAEVAALIESYPGTLYLSVHPERWADGPVDLAYCTLVDALAANAKRTLRIARAVSARLSR